VYVIAILNKLYYLQINKHIFAKLLNITDKPLAFSTYWCGELGLNLGLNSRNFALVNHDG